MAGLAAVPPLQVVDIPDVELCSVGKWNGRDYTAAEFDEAAAHARELAGVYHIPLKLGHSDTQLLAGQSDGDPALGWVENVRRKGQSLYGDLKNVPAKLAQLIKSGAYRGRSAEFWLDTEFAGKPRAFMLKAVALLGVDAPAVEGLSDITALYNSRAAVALAAAARQTVTLADAATKTEDGKAFRKSDYAYTPTDTPSDWKLRITKTPGGAPDSGLIGAAAAAMGKGFRGNKASIPQADRGKVKSKLRGLWTRANPDKSEDEMPEVLKNSLAKWLTALPTETALGYLAYRARHPQTLNLVSGPKLDDIQSAVMKALQAQYPPAKGDEDDDDATPGADGPSCNVIDWFLNSDPPSVVVSDQDVDNLWEIPFQYDPDQDTATLQSPIPVKGTYTQNQTGMETGEDEPASGSGDSSGDTAPPADDGETAMNARLSLSDLCLSLVQLADAHPEAASLKLLARIATEQPHIARLSDGDVQKAVAKILAAIDQTITDLSATAGGRPGMGFIRTTLTEIKRKLGSMKFPKPAQTASNSLVQPGGTDVDLATLARSVGLPPTSSEAEVNARLAQLQVQAQPPAQRADLSHAEAPVVATLAAEVASLKAERDSRRLNEALDAAADQGRMTPPLREEMVKLAKKTGIDATIAVIGALPKVVDLSERGRDGGAGSVFGGQMPAGAVALLTRDHGEAWVQEHVSDTRSLAEKREAFLAAKARKEGRAYTPIVVGR